MTTHCLLRRLLAVLLGLIPLAAGAAEPGDLERALAKPTHLAFVETPLKDVVDFLSHLHKISVLADGRTLEAAGISPKDTPITATVKGQPLGKALDRVLRPKKLAWLVRHGVLWVTTEKAAREKYLQTRVYRLTRDVPPDKQIASITKTVARESWCDVGGPGDAAPIAPRFLVIHQSPVVHRQIAAKFAKSLQPVPAQPLAADKAPAAEKKLATPTRLELRDVSLPDALAYLRDLHALKITLDKKSLSNAGIRAASPITMRVKDVDLASVLSLMVEQVDASLTWTANDDGVTITTVEAAQAKLIGRTYQVSDIVPDRGRLSLIEAIQTTVAQQDWEAVGGQGVIQPGTGRGTLVVRQSYPVHRQLRQLLADLRAARKQTEKEK